jgi:hypothetical protein
MILMLPRLILLLALLLAPLESVGIARAQQPSVATLTILAGAVQVLPAGSQQPSTASDGMSLSVGARVLTGPDATALVTFLDGSTLTVQPSSDIAVKVADAGSGRPSLINIQVNLGTVWARVVRLLDPRSSFSLESNSAIAAVHDGEIGAQVNLDGSFVCWTREGDLVVTPRSGAAALTLMPGTATTVAAGQTSGPRPWRLESSELHLLVPSGLLPLVQMPDGARLVGFAGENLEVNQVFGAHAERRSDGSRVVDLPAGQSGPYTVFLEGEREGNYQVEVIGSYEGSQVYQVPLGGSFKAGERFSSRLSQQLDQTNAANPREARAVGVSVAPLERFNGDWPGKPQTANPADSTINAPSAGVQSTAVALALVVLAGTWLRGRRLVATSS